MISKTMKIINLEGSSSNFSAQRGRGKEKKIAAAKISVRPRKNTAEGGCGGNSAVFLQKNRGQARRLARSEQNPAKKFSFPFTCPPKPRRRRGRKNPVRANQEKRRKLFCGVASGSEQRRAGFLGLVSFRGFG